MTTLEQHGPNSTRRDFLKASGVGAVGFSLAQSGAFALAPSERSVIFLMMVGGPSQLETFDPKPSAPSEIRGPFRAIETSVPGIRINEYLPKIAARMDRLALIRTLHHDSAPIHETGYQLLQTGRLCRQGSEYPHVGALAARELGGRGPLPSWAILPGPIGPTGVDIPHGQSAAGLGADFEPLILSGDGAKATLLGLSKESDRVRDSFGKSSFGRNCLLARKLVEAGVRVVTVNMFETVFQHLSWDCHGREPFSTLSDYRQTLLPTFDTAFSGLIDDLERVGRLESTLVVATGEFGRTPKLNNQGGRDHWPSAWSAILAGGGISGGQVVGKTDAHAGEPIDRPVGPEELLATIGQHLGLSPSFLEGWGPIRELFA